MAGTTATIPWDESLQAPNVRPPRRRRPGHPLHRAERASLRRRRRDRRHVPEERLRRILYEGRIRSFTTFGSGAPIVGFTESTQPAVTKLIAEARYAPFGIGFSKQVVFDRNGGPALNVRGDEWGERERLPQPLRSRLVRFWPAAEAEEPAPSACTGRQRARPGREGRRADRPRESSEPQRQAPRNHRTFTSTCPHRRSRRPSVSRLGRESRGSSPRTMSKAPSWGRMAIRTPRH